MRLFLLSLCVGLTTLAATPQTDSIAAVHQLGEVVVTGSNAPIGRNLLPYTLSTIGSEQLEATASQQLLSAVSGLVPSLFVTQRNIFGFGVSNGGSGHIKLRGVGGDRASAVLMMVDGQPQFAGLYSHHVADFYSVETVERVEVLRGPASVLYGSNAMAGVINVITKEPHKQGVNTTLTSQYGSYNTWLTSLNNYVRYGKFSSILTAEYNRTDGVSENFDFNQLSVYAKVGYKISSRWSAKADYSLTSFNAHDPIYPSIKGQTGIYSQKVIRGETSLTAVNTYVNTNGSVRAYYSYGNHFIHDPAYFHSLDDRLGIIAYQNFKPWLGAEATLGFDFDRYTGKIPISGGKDYQQAPLATLQRRHIVEYSPYIALQQSFCSHMFSLNGGLRMACSNLFSTHWVPQAGFAVTPSPGWIMKASISKGYRNPSFRELYLYKFANPNLQPETMVNYEVSLGKSFGQLLSCDITAYFSRGSNLIQQTATANENTGSFINKGLELSLKSRPHKLLSLWASYSYLHSSLSNLTGAPRHQYYLGMSWEVFKKFHLDAELKGVSHLFVDKSVAMQNYATIDLKMKYRLLRQLQLLLSLDNITAARYMINKGYPMPGVTAMGGFKLSF